MMPVSMTASEAASLDPQLRMLLEITFECFESGKLISRPKASNWLTCTQRAYPLKTLSVATPRPL